MASSRPEWPDILDPSFRTIYGEELLALPNVGKTNQIKNLIYYAIPKYKKIFLLHAVSGIEGAGVPPDYQGFGVELLKEIPDLKFWDDYEDEKTMLIVDDYNLASNRKRLPILERTFGYASTHKGVSCIMALQNGFDPLSLPFRRHCNLFIFFKSEDKRYLERLVETAGIPKDKIKDIFKKYNFSQHDSLWIDYTGNPDRIRVIVKEVMTSVKKTGIKPLEEQRFMRFDRFQRSLSVPEKKPFREKRKRKRKKPVLPQQFKIDFDKPMFR